MRRNRLALETSPYLLQHAGNPVDWHPWGEEALQLAKRQNKPILLSVGYSACHWCHVMAHESFEDPAIAALMNRLFVNIKVDREERPDLDKIYQLAQQLITQRHGGWPLTMFLAPEDQRPFFGGTYFPKEPQHGLPGFGDLLERVAEYYHSHGAEIREQNEQLAQFLEQLAPAGPPPGLALDRAPLLAARRALEKDFDPRFGGFGRAPKFPLTGSIERCLRHWRSTSQGAAPDLKALYMATLTLTRMADGGIFDQLGGGFSRYSVDDRWMIPHFEKMLYDNGQLLCTYAWANLATGEALFARVAGETADWILREMRSPDGAFCSSIDADSEGHEGRFYVWSRAEVEAVLTGPEYRVFARRFGLDREPNFEGRWHLHVVETLESAAASADLTSAGATAASNAGAAAALLDSARAKLLRARDLRVRPARDDKTLSSWNALAIKGLAVAGRVLNRPDLVAAASAALDFIRRALWRDGRLLATFKDGRAHLPAYLDDYAFLADALLELMQCRWRTEDLDLAVQLLEVMLAKFEDPGGGFYFTAADHEHLIHRSKTFGDESVPAGNGVAASVLCRMGHLLGDTRYLRAAERTLAAAWSVMAEHPQAHMSLLNAAEDFLSPPQMLIIRGDAAEAAAWSQNLNRMYAPSRMVFAIPADAAGLPPALADKRAGPSTVAYLCSGTTCSAPLADLGDLVRRLSSGIGG
jgi:uncharacterized protein YyaL (SSP411 family)